MSAPSDAPRRAADRRGELIGSAFAVLMGAQFSFVVILGKDVLVGSGHPFVLLTARFAGTAVALAILAVATGRPLVPEPGERRGIALAGLLGYGTEAAFYFAALGHGNAGAVTLLFYTYPVIVMLASIAMDRRIPAGRLVTALVLAVGGSAIVVIGGSGLEIETAGIVLALCSATAYSAYLIGADRVIKRSNPMTAALWLAGGAALANAVFAIGFGDNVVPRGADWWQVAGMSAFTLGAFVAMLASLQRIGAVRNGIIGVIEPLTVAILAWIFLAEPISLSTGFGGTLILAGAVLATLVRTRRIREPDL
ncbi:MAG TPA: DMT family transporter [Actinomycetota bacterium]|nr:DMT family transporter [Actinomycetota bacterium]